MKKISDICLEWEEGERRASNGVAYRKNLREIDAQVRAGNEEEIPGYTERLASFKLAVEEKCGGADFATTNALRIIHCVTCSIQSQNNQLQYQNRTINDVDRFMLTHFKTCIKPRLAAIPEKVASALHDAEERQKSRKLSSARHKTKVSQDASARKRIRENGPDEAKVRKSAAFLKDFMSKTSARAAKHFAKDYRGEEAAAAPSSNAARAPALPLPVAEANLPM